MRRITTEEFMRRAILKHGTRYDYGHVEYVDMNTNVEIICSVHGVFMQSPNNHLKGHGCPICNRIDKRRLSVDTFIERSRQVHGDQYDYSKVEYVNSKTPVKIICPVHGEFMQKPEKHMVGHACPSCCANAKDTRESFIEKARAVHGDLYDYSKVEYVNSWTKVLIVDPKYGEFWQKPNAHLNGEGCPMRKPELCYIAKKKNHSFNTSKPEILVEGMLVDKFGRDDVVKEYRSDRYGVAGKAFSCDFYIRSLDLYIELNIHVTHGFHWFDATDPEDLARLAVITERSNGRSRRNMYERIIEVWTKRDPAKRAVAIQNNLNYLVFWRQDLKDFKDWYDNFDFDNPVLKNI